MTSTVARVVMAVIGLSPRHMNGDVDGNEDDNHTNGHITAAEVVMMRTVHGDNDGDDGNTNTPHSTCRALPRDNTTHTATRYCMRPHCTAPHDDVFLMVSHLMSCGDCIQCTDLILHHHSQSLIV